MDGEKKSIMKFMVILYHVIYAVIMVLYMRGLSMKSHPSRPHIKWYFRDVWQGGGIDGNKLSDSN